MFSKSFLITGTGTYDFFQFNILKLRTPTTDQTKKDSASTAEQESSTLLNSYDRKKIFEAKENVLN